MERADAHGAYAAAHSLKGSAGNIGARRLQSVCLVIEGAARNGDLATVGTLVEQLKREADLVNDEIAALIGT